MGRLIVTEFMTLDGVAQAPGMPDEDPEGGFTHGGWQAPVSDDEAGDDMFEDAQTMDELLLGRKTYEIFAAHWPYVGADDPIGPLFDRVTKYVATRDPGLTPHTVSPVGKSVDPFARGARAISPRSPPPWRLWASLGLARRGRATSARPTTPTR